MNLNMTDFLAYPLLYNYRRRWMNVYVVYEIGRLCAEQSVADGVYSPLTQENYVYLATCCLPTFQEYLFVNRFCDTIAVRLL